MESTIGFFEKGMVFYLQDKEVKSSGVADSHNYLIVADGSSKKQRVQCMTITSCKNGEEEWAIPVLLNNRTVSYILPYVLYPYTDMAFKLSAYHGVLQKDIMEKSEFLEFCMLCFYMINDFPTGKKSPEDIRRLHSEYCKRFWEKYSEYNTYAAVKYGSNLHPVEPETVYKDSDSTVTSKVIPDDFKLEITNDTNDKSVLSSEYGTMPKYVREWTDEELVRFYNLGKSNGYLWIANIFGLDGYHSGYDKCKSVEREIKKRNLTV